MSNPLRLVRTSGLVLLLLATLGAGLGYLALGSSAPGFPGESLLVRLIGLFLLVSVPLLALRRPWGFRLAAIGWGFVLVELLAVLATGGAALADMPPGAVAGLLLGVVVLVALALMLGRSFAPPR